MKLFGIITKIYGLKKDKKNQQESQHNHTNIDKYRVGGNITEYHIISKLISLGIIIQNSNMPKLMNYKCQIYWVSYVDYRVASLFTRYLTAKGIIPESLKLIDQL